MIGKEEYRTISTYTYMPGWREGEEENLALVGRGRGGRVSIPGWERKGRKSIYPWLGKEREEEYLSLTLPPQHRSLDRPASECLKEREGQKSSAQFYKSYSIVETRDAGDLNS